MCKQRDGLARVKTLGMVALLACLTVGLLVWRPWARGAHPSYREYLEQAASPSPVDLDTKTQQRIERFCGDCHALPRAQNIPRDAWHDWVARGYVAYARSGRKDLDPPPLQQSLAYYRSRAPEQLEFRAPVDSETALRATFAVEKLPFKPAAGLPPANSHLRWARLDPQAEPVLLTCDMRYGSVTAVDLRGPNVQPRVLARLQNPTHIEPCDLDGDKAIDLVVADAGTEFGLDHDLGRIVWLRPQALDGSFAVIELATGLGRPTDIEAADFDRDGDLDLLVADFGADQTGNIVLLKNESVDQDRPRFIRQVVDIRPGSIHVPVHDFDQDGWPDFAALVSQEYEEVDVFINQGGAGFHLHRTWAAPDLTFGSSGAALADLDQDGDMDILITNGDVLVSDYANPSHGVQWLENQGDLQFAHHRLADMPGAYRALAGDIDLDGDLDIVAVAMFSRDVRPAKVTQAPFGSIVCLEQTSPGEFARHTLETGFSYHATLEMADFDQDGDLDFATGTFSVQKRRFSHWLCVWRNQLVAEEE